MQIPVKALEKWNLLKSEGDPIKILEAYEEKNGESVHLETIRLAMRTGKCSDEVFEAIATFYNEKFEKVKALA